MKISCTLFELNACGINLNGTVNSQALAVINKRIDSTVDFTGFGGSLIILNHSRKISTANSK